MNHETLIIKKVVNGGYGLSHLTSGEVVLIRFALPGEKIRVLPKEIKKDVLFGSIEQILTEHPGRKSPPCLYYGQCGGCNLQHCSYDTQLYIKESILRDIMLRQGNDAVAEAVALIASPLPSPDQFGYRQRIRLQLSDQGIPGFHRHQSHEIIPVERCLLAGADLNTSLTALGSHRDAMALSAMASEMELLTNPASGSTVCIFTIPRKPRPADKLAARRIACDIEIIEHIYFRGATFHIEGPFGPAETDTTTTSMTVTYPRLAGLPADLVLSWEVGGFCQVNLKQNRHLIETVLALSDVKPDDRIIDLFCGMGNFSLPIAMLGGRVHGYEGQGAAIRAAKNNARIADIDNTIFIKSPIHQACDDLVRQGARFDCAVIDPPRQGIPGMAPLLSTITTKKLIYISCDPATLCRDLNELTTCGFSIRAIQPIDMFPQTHHIETVVLLHR